MVGLRGHPPALQGRSPGQGSPAAALAAAVCVALLAAQWDAALHDRYTRFLPAEIRIAGALHFTLIHGIGISHTSDLSVWHGPSLSPSDHIEMLGFRLQVIRWDTTAGGAASGPVDSWRIEVPFWFLILLSGWLPARHLTRLWRRRRDRRRGVLGHGFEVSATKSSGTNAE